MDLELFLLVSTLRSIPREVVLQKLNREGVVGGCVLVYTCVHFNTDVGECDCTEIKCFCVYIKMPIQPCPSHLITYLRL